MKSDGLAENPLYYGPYVGRYLATHFPLIRGIIAPDIGILSATWCT